MSQIAKYFTGLLIVLINLIPVYGVLNWGWQSFDLIFLYWLENLVIGFFMLLGILIRRYPEAGEIVMSMISIPFTAFHYTVFCIFHGIFIAAIFSKLEAGRDPLEAFYSLVIIEVQSLDVKIALVALFIMHFFQWIKDKIDSNFITEPGKLIFTSYIRIVITHLTIFICGFFLSSAGNPAIGLLFIVVIKIVSDVYFYIVKANSVKQQSVKKK